MIGPAERAIFYKPEQAFARGAAKLAPHMFRVERNKAYAAQDNTWLELDSSRRLKTRWPCTTPAMLARYGTLRKEGALVSFAVASGSVLYVLRGTGETRVRGETISWGAGDVFCVPGFEHVEHRGLTDSIVFEVSDAPLFSLLGVDRGVRRSIDFTHFERTEIERGLDEVHSRVGEQKSAGKCVVCVTQACATLRLLTPTLLASINSLEPHGSQRSHRHNSAALTLAVAGNRVFSEVDGQRIDWMEGAAMLTPPGAVHSHHNHGPSRMMSFVVQDTGLHTYLQTTAFEWTAEDDVQAADGGRESLRRKKQEAFK